jgi:hypothetical protein
MNTYVVTYKSFSANKTVVVRAVDIPQIIRWLNKDGKYKQVERNVWKTEEDSCIVIKWAKEYVLHG